MQDYSFNICPDTYNREEFLCTDLNCLKQNKKRLFCHICLTKMHIDKKSNSNHFENFVDIGKLMVTVTQKREQRIEFLEDIKKQNQKFTKEKIQDIGRCEFFTQEQKEQFVDKVQTEAEYLLNFIGDHEQKLTQVCNYSYENQGTLIELYRSDENEFDQQVTKKMKAVQDSIDNFLEQSQFNVIESCQNSKRRIEQLELRISQLEPRISQLELQVAPNLIGVFIFFILILFFCLKSQQGLQNCNDNLENLEKHQPIINDQTMITDNFNDIQKQIGQLKISFFQYISNAVETINRFNTQNLFSHLFKEHEQFLNNQFALNQIYNLEIENLQACISQANSKFNRILEVLNQPPWKLDKWSNYMHYLYGENKIYFKDATSLDQTKLQLKKEKLSLIEKNIHNFSHQSKYNERLALNFNKTQQILGKILINFPIEQLHGFVKIYDEFLDKTILFSELRQLSLSLTEKSIVCIGAVSIKQISLFQIMACDFVEEVFYETTNTTQARQSKTEDDLYWYFVQNHSFGFAQKQQIQLGLVDLYDEDDGKRFSCQLDSQKGEGRISKIKGNQKNNKDFKFLIYALI